jgi:hypothetical protein
MTDFVQLKTPLVNSKMQVQNSALFQTINGLIDTSQKATDDLQVSVAVVQSLVEQLNTTTIVDVDTSGAPQTVVLSDVINGLTVIKDIAGNASVNNITLTGVVEGITNPVINTNFGFYHVYLSKSDGLLHTW